MTVSSTTRSAGPFTGNGATTAFPFTFLVFAATDVVVKRVSAGVTSTLVQGIGYSVSLNASQSSSPGGTVNLIGGALAAGDTLTITSAVPNLQPADLQNRGGFYPEAIESALDRATVQIQQIQDQNNANALVAPSSDPAGTNYVLPSVAARTGKFMAFDTNGGVIASPGTGTDNTLRTELADNIGASLGANLVGHRQSGTGAVGRTVKAILGDRPTVKDFGAVGDGTTNDTAAFSAAMDALTFVRVPIGTYSLSSAPTGSGRLVADYGVSFTGTGATAAMAALAVPLVGGIKFPSTAIASADANTLDDYEEGTWTPSMQANIATNVPAGTSRGYYRKIGSMIHLWFHLGGLNNSGITGGYAITIDGLPYASFNDATATIDYGGVISWYNGFSLATGVSPGCMIGDGAQNIYMARLGYSGGTSTALAASDLGTNCNLRGYIAYPTA